MKMIVDYFPYQIYSIESSRRSFNFGFSMEALIKYIKKTSIYFQVVSLIKP